jgi:hypothetical protein
MHHDIGTTIVWNDEAVSLNGVVPFNLATYDNAGTGLRICQHSTLHTTRANANYHYISATLPPQTKNALDSDRNRRNIDGYEIASRFYMRIILVMVVSAILPLSGCLDTGMTQRSARQPLVEKTHHQRMLVLTRPPVIQASSSEEVSAAVRVAANADTEMLSKRESARWVGIDALPFLTSTDSGEQFLAAAFPRALARGMPPESCPVAAMAGGIPGIPSGAVVGEALQNCLAEITPARPDCGCRIVALDDLVTAPRGEFAYATGTTSRLRSASLGIDLLLVAEETNGDGTLLRDLNGPVAHLAYGEKDSVSLTFVSNDRQFNGYRVQVGYRRGRIAERIYATDADGNRLTLLIGFGPDELAEGAGAWLAWPPEG